MEITRQLRKDKLTKKGFAPIQVTICWAGHRVRVFSGDKCRPEHWDDTDSRVKAVKGSYYAQINPKLDDIRNAAEKAQDAAEQQRRRLTEAELLAAVEAITKPTKAAASAEPDAAPVEAPAAPRSMMGTADAPSSGWFEQWISEQAMKVSKKTKKRTSANTLKAYRSTLQRLRAFEDYRQAPLRFEEMTLVDFYGPFSNYVLDHLGKEINTFGKYIAHLNTFLTWCDVDQELPVHRQYRKFTAPEEYIGVDALTDSELLAIAALDFADPALQPLLFQGYAEQCQARADYNRQKGHKSYTWSKPSPESEGFRLFRERIELARDKFLQCCYLGVSISDADAMPRTCVRGQMIEWRRGKSANDCYIPYFDDSIFKPVALAAKYAGQTELLVPRCYDVNELLKVIARLVHLTRLNLSTKIGRKTFVTIKLYQGVPQRLVMQATGHTTEAAFNRYVGVDVLKLLEQFKRHSPTLLQAS